MTRNLRKRHLIMWCIITGLLAILLVYARVNMPVFSGDVQKVEKKK
ncbi:MAG: hypothetical protein GDA37_02770 [Ekhidna sp.]|nr:hypothetical protein [Ekhidna sp.]